MKHKKIFYFVILSLFISTVFAWGCSKGSVESRSADLLSEEAERLPGIEEIPTTESGESIEAMIAKIEVILLNYHAYTADKSRPFPRAVDSLRINFSSDMDPQVKDGFKILSNESEVRGSFSWIDSKTLEFIPDPDYRFPYSAKNKVMLDGAAAAEFDTMVLNDVDGKVLEGKRYADIFVGTSSVLDGIGRAYLISGKPSWDNMTIENANVTIVGELMMDHFGDASAVVGDLNADGYADIMVGAPDYKDANPRFGGRVYIFFGGPDLSSTLEAANAPVKITGKDDMGWLGLIFAAAGDVDGDGYDDIILAKKPHPTNDGQVYFFSGRRLGPSQLPVDSADVTITGEPQFGASLCSVDIDKDGFKDIVVGSPRYKEAMTSEAVGKVYVFKGSKTMADIDLNDPSVKADFTIAGLQENSWFGNTMDNAGDVDNDGTDDLVIGAQEWVTGALDDVGRVFLFSGAALAADRDQDLTKAVHEFSGLAAGDRLGACISAAGHFKGNQYADFIIGSKFIGGISGYARLILNNASIEVPMEGTSYGVTMFASSMGSLGDINDDGFSDIAITAYGSSDSTVIVFFGNEAGLVDKYIHVTGISGQIDLRTTLGRQLDH